MLSTRLLENCILLCSLPIPVVQIFDSGADRISKAVIFTSPYLLATGSSSQVDIEANIADATQIDQLLHGEENFVSAPVGYTGVDKRPLHHIRKLIWLIASRPNTYKNHRKKSLIAQATTILG